MAMRTGWLAVLALAAATSSSTPRLTDPRPAPFHERLHAAHFPRAPRWRTRISAPSRERPPCLRQRVSWASTVPFADSPSSLPPQKMIARLPPDGIVMAVVQYVCRPVRGLTALRPPLNVADAQCSDFPGARGDACSVYVGLRGSAWAVGRLERAVAPRR
jgi:hypothetical protein